jgi:hypothetical protein
LPVFYYIIDILFQGCSGRLFSDYRIGHKAVQYIIW